MRRGRRVGITPNTPAWLAWRARGITASDTAAILGLSPWTSPYDLWHRKAADRAALDAGEALPESDSSQRFAIGHALEPVLHDFYAAEELGPGERLMSGGCWQGVGADEWLRATPDRVVTRIGKRTPLRLVEFKTTAQTWGDDADGVPDIPAYYRAQIVHQALICGVREVTLTALTGRMEITHWHVVATEDELALVHQATRDFEQSLRDGQEPDIDGHAATGKRLAEQWGTPPDDSEATVAYDIAARWEIARQALEAAKANEATVRHELLAQMADAKRAVLADGTKVATRSVIYRSTFDRKAFAAEHPDLDAHFTRVSDTPTVQLRAAGKAPKGEKLK